MKHSNSTLETLWRRSYEEGDVTLMKMVESQMYNPRDWDEFVVDVILTQSLVNKSLRDQLVDVISHQPPRPIYITAEQARFVPDGARSDDYPTDFTPDGAWPLKS